VDGRTGDDQPVSGRRRSAPGGLTARRAAVRTATPSRWRWRLVFAILVLIGGACLLWQQPTRRHDATA
jgi:hypothetical protein